MALPKLACQHLVCICKSKKWTFFDTFISSFIHIAIINFLLCLISVGRGSWPLTCVNRCTAALLLEYAKWSTKLTRMPSMLPILSTRAGSSLVPAASKRGRALRVRLNVVWCHMQRDMSSMRMNLRCPGRRMLTREDRQEATYLYIDAQNLVERR